jgi:hypothetical protein
MRRFVVAMALLATVGCADEPSVPRRPTIPHIELPPHVRPPFPKDSLVKKS